MKKDLKKVVKSQRINSFDELPLLWLYVTQRAFLHFTSNQKRTISVMQEFVSLSELPLVTERTRGVPGGEDAHPKEFLFK